MITLEYISENTDKSVEELNAELAIYTEKIYNDYEGKLTGQDLADAALYHFVLYYKSVIASLRKSPAEPIKVFVTGVSRRRDNVTYDRGRAIKSYQENPNLAVLHAKVNEYIVLDDVITKKYFDTEKKVKVSEVVNEIPNNAEHFKENIFLAPRDSKKSFGLKPNPNYGKELPAHVYMRDVHGIAQIGDIPKKFILTLKGINTAVKNLPVPGNAYMVRLVNKSIKEENEYKFYDSPTATKWIPVKWDAYEEGTFIENVLTEPFMEPYLAKLGDLKGIAQREFDEKAINKNHDPSSGRKIWEYTKFNSCLFTEAELVKITLFPESENKISRIVIDDAEMEEDLDNLVDITGWLSESAIAGLDTGERSKAILCCYPKIMKSKIPGGANTMSVDVFGIMSKGEHRTNFNRKEYEKLSNLDDFEE